MEQEGVKESASGKASASEVDGFGREQDKFCGETAFRTLLAGALVLRGLAVAVVAGLGAIARLGRGAQRRADLIDRFHPGHSTLIPQIVTARGRSRRAKSPPPLGIDAAFIPP